MPMGAQMAIFLLAGGIVYFLPTLIAALRVHPQFRLIFLQNLLFGWSPFDWIAALCKACGPSLRRTQSPLL
jgi:hypothetical protein